MNTEERAEARDHTMFTFLAAARRIRVSMAQSLARVGVTPADYELLAHLRAGAWCGVQDFREDVLERLAKKGMIRRMGNGSNRVGVARITHAGRNVLEQCDAGIEVVRATFAANFTAPERSALTDFLDKLP